MDDLQRIEIEEAIAAADEALYHLNVAKKNLRSAGNWGIYDMIGGGFISGLIKHGKIENAEEEIQAAKEALETFAEELRDVSGYSSIHIDSFLKFGDLVFDGFLMDALVQHEIGKAKAQCDDAINQVSRIREELAYSLR
ncbi:MAG: hypothetical protein IKR39_01300 [Lachnospiraceae bacterium]|nr:hypothetical protein [Lachnospiraceae bacterium]